MMGQSGQRYRTIVADPPWEYGEGFPSHVGGRVSLGKGGTVSKPLPYQSMTLERITAMDVRALADPAGAFVWLWTTNRYLPDAFGVLEAWGFPYVQMFVWIKDRRLPFAAALAPNHAEYALVGRAGSVRRIGTARSNVLEVAINPNKVSHSAKPDAFYDLVEQVSPEPRCELFGRRARFGWDYPIGDQALGGRAA